MEREGVQNMIDLAIAKFHGENVERLSEIKTTQAEIRQRIIGMDGNGTGKIGVLQRQDMKLAELSEKQDMLESNQTAMNVKLDTIIHQTTSWDKAKVWEALKWMFATILAILSLILGYLGYRAIMHPQGAVAQHASLSSTQTAGAE